MKQYLSIIGSIAAIILVFVLLHCSTSPITKWLSFPEEQDNFIPTYKSQAIAVESISGFPARVMLGLVGLQTDEGVKVDTATNNLFGIRSPKDSSLTKYTFPAVSMMEFALIITRSGWAPAQLDPVNEWCHALKEHGVYEDSARLHYYINIRIPEVLETTNKNESESNRSVQAED